MSVGQAVGGIAGAVVGFFLPGVGFAIGAQVGLMIGGYIDPPKGPNIEGPRLTDLTVQTSTYGAPKTRAYGTIAVTGNVFWLEGDAYVEHAHEQESGGKGGGGGATQTSYTYSATWAVALCEGQEVTGIRRLWLGDELIYDAGSDDVESIIASNIGGGFLGGSAFNSVVSWWLTALSSGHNWKLYTGADDQEPDPRMQADKGEANVSAYPGRCYIVFYDQDLTEKYSNTLLRAQVKAELVCAGTLSQEVEPLFDKWAGNTGTYGNRFPIVAMAPGAQSCGYAVFQSSTDSTTPISVNFGNIEYPYTDETLVKIPTYLVGIDWGYTWRAYQVVQADIPAVLTSQIQYNAVYLPWFRLFTPAGQILDSGRYISQSGLSWESGGSVIFDRGDIFLFGDSGKLQKIDVLYGLQQQTSAYTQPGWCGASENYIFIITNAGAYIRKISRVGFSEVATYSTVAALSLHVVDDDTFYSTHTGSGTTTDVQKWVDGVVEKTYLSAFSGQRIDSYFVVTADDPLTAVGAHLNPLDDTWYWLLSHPKLPSNSAKLRDIVTEECALAGIDSTDLDLTDLTNSDVRGYRVAGVGSPRAALEPLQAAFPFDVYQKGYAIGFKSRGGASVVTVPEVDLGAGEGNSADFLMPVAREMETQIARLVTVKHIDADRDYEIGEQTSPERPGVSSVAPRTVDLALVLTADEAAQVADVLNSKDWTERVSFGPFSLPPTYAGLEAADVITVQHRSRNWEMRLTRVEYMPDGRLVCSGVLTASAAYASTVQGSDPLALGKSLVPLYGSSRAVLMDIPVIDSTQDAYGISAALYGFTNSWPGGVLVRSDDAGETYQTIAGFTARAEVFQASDALAAGRTDIIDTASVLTVTPLWVGADLFSITEAQLLAGGNLAAYGADGRWEVVCFKTVSLSGETYTLTDFRRGLYGTEWAMALHQVDDKLVMLDSTTAQFIGLPTALLNSARPWRAVTNGAPVASASDVMNTYGAVNLKPLSPVFLNGSRDPTSRAWSLSWTRRTRIGGEWVDFIDAPLSESSEAYEVEIWDSGYSTLKRTITGLTSASAGYTSAQQIADFGAEQSTLYVRVYQLSARVERGFALQTSISRSLSLDPYIEQVVLGMHFSTDLSDIRAHTATAYGNAGVSGGKCNFDGTGDYLLLDGNSNLAPGTSKFTLEMYYTPNALVDGTLWDSRVSNGANITLFALATGGVNLYVNGGYQITSATGLLSVGVEVHIALCRDASNNTRLFINGTQTGSTYVDGNNYQNNASRPAIGANGASLGVTQLNGKIRELRYTLAARYTANFTPPSIPFPDS